MKYKLYTLPYIGPVLLTITLLLFRIPVSRLLDTVIVKPLFISFEPGAWVDFAFIAFLLFIVIWITLEFNIRFLVRIAIYGLIFYAFQRANTYWTFYSMILFPQFAYWDIMAITYILPLFLYPLIRLKSDTIQQAPLTQGFTEDNVVASYDEDHFKRKASASEIARLIQLTNNRKSFAIGVLGEYGSGKTSFLNLINLGLNDTQVLRIHFDPWSAGSPEAIRKDFFDLLASKVASMDQKISSLIYSYGRKLSTFDARSLSWLNWFNFLQNPISTQTSGEYQQINKILTTTHRKIVITIDDLDRLYPSEIMEVLKLIRNTASFSNVFYLVGYDKKYVQDAIGSLNESSSQDYLDKIFQLEIPLPKREENDLIKILQEQLKDFISAAHYQVFEDEIIPIGFNSRYDEGYGSILRHGRDVVRFVNGYKIIYSLIGEEVDFKCLLLLELIKFRFPTVYELIYIMSNQFLYETPMHSTHEQYFSPRMIKTDDTNDETSVFKMHIQKMKWLKLEDISLLNNLFLSLFEGRLYHRPKTKNSISYPLYFNIYFRYRLSQTDISDKEYRVALASSNMLEYMNYCATYNLHKELMIRLFQEDISKNRLHFERIITFIFSFGRTFVEKEGFIRFDYEALLNKIYNYQNIVTDDLYRKDADSYRLFIKNLFDSAFPPYVFENALIYHIKKKGGDFVIATDDLTAYQLSYFTRFAESSHGLNENALWNFWGARKYERHPAEKPGSYYESWRFEPDLVHKMKHYLSYKDPKEFLKFSIQREMRDKSYVSIATQVLDMFDNPEDYRKLVAENPTLDEDIRLEYLELFDKYAVKDFKQPVEMEFKTELQKPE